MAAWTDSPNGPLRRAHAYDGADHDTDAAPDAPPIAGPDRDPIRHPPHHGHSGRACRLRPGCATGNILAGAWPGPANDGATDPGEPHAQAHAGAVSGRA